MTVSSLLDNISSKELTEWMIYDKLEPFGDSRGDIQAGIISASVYNSQGGNKGKAYSPSDFIPKFWAKEEQVDYRPMLNTVILLNTMFNGTDNRKINQ
jgi:hypothetical protein